MSKSKRKPKGLTKYKLGEKRDARVRKVLREQQLRRAEVAEQMEWHMPYLPIDEGGVA